MEISKSFFPIKTELLYGNSLSYNAKILLAIMYRHRNNEHIVNKSHTELSYLTNISGASNVRKYLGELINNKMIENMSKERKKSIYKINYRINFDSDSFVKLYYDFIGKYHNALIINFFQLQNMANINNYAFGDLNLYTMRGNILSNWLSKSDVLEVMVELTEAKLFDFTYKARSIYDIEMNDIKKEARPQSNPTSQHINNIQQPTTNITVEKKWYDNPDWKLLKITNDAAEYNVKKYEKQSSLTEEELEILNAYKLDYATNLEKMKQIEQRYLMGVE